MSNPLPSYSGSPFANRDLRNRSFRRQILNGADFSGSDLRGCDFSNAELINASFRHVKTGLSRRQQWVYGIIALVSFGFMFDIVSQLVFSSLGQTTDDRAWRFVVALYGVLGLAGLGTAVRFWSDRNRCGRWAEMGSRILSAALVGFFYAGSSSGNNITIATLGALLGGGFAALQRQRSSIGIVTAAAGSVCAYGFSFWVGATAIALLSVQRSAAGVGVCFLTLFCLWLTVAGVRLLIQEMREAVGTCFRGANLTDAQFDSACLPNTDFSKAISN